MKRSTAMDSRPAAGSIGLVERGLVPDPLVRAGIRRLCEQRLADIEAADCERAAARASRFVEAMRAAPIAPLPQLANEQHYELPPEFFGLVLGPHRKYSSAWWPEEARTLGDAEAAALEATAARAGLADGQRVLELGCGWGSLTLWMARHFRNSRITAVSNSHSQGGWILSRARAEGLANVQVITADINDFAHIGGFDRIVSVEMFEHLRNWPKIFRRLSDWLVPGGRFFMHVFCHRSTPYAFEVADESDWMSRYFFSGGMMPSDDLAPLFQDHLHLLERWRWDGRHYERTANAWLDNLDMNRERIMAIFAGVYGAADAALWLQRWRLFFMACAELFGYRRGQEWWVGHYLFERPHG